MYLCGEFKHTIDAKNRLFIPSKHREQLGERIMVVPSFQNKCLLVYSLSEWDKFIESVLEKVPATKRQGMNRFLFRNSLEVEYDSQGRILLSQSLCEIAQLGKGPAIIVGCGAYDEIWCEENYTAVIDSEDPEEFTEILGQYGL